MSPLADPPPVAIQERVATQMARMFRPLTPDEIAEVSVTRDEAERFALGNRWMKYYDADGKLQEVVWKKVGCVFLGHWTGPEILEVPYRAPEEGSVYLVQLLADPIPGFPGDTIAIQVVDAIREGGGESFVHAGLQPAGLFGTTCGETS